MSNKKKCIAKKCGKDATKVYRPDLDLSGLGMCDEHEDEISMDILVANFEEDGWEEFKKKYID